MTPALRKLAALGAYAVSAGLAAVFGFLVWLMWPTQTAGMNTTVLVVGILCAACPIGLLIAIHVVLGRLLTRPDYGP
jgi:hypothetical protein